MESIYEQIRAAVQPDGTLPRGFSIQKRSDSPSALRFADGARDGIAFYHARPSRDEGLLTCLEQVTSMVSCGGDYNTAEKMLSSCLGGQDNLLGCIDSLQEWIIQHKEILDARKLFDFSSSLLTQSASAGAVKYALTVLELLASVQGQWREAVRTLALSDELTLYCVWVAKNWEDSGEELFSMAQKARGWGRVHAVRELEPTRQEMRDWLLDEGWNNDVLSSYSSYPCAVNGGLLERLSGAVTREQLDAAGNLVAALLDEGPLLNLSRMGSEDREGLLLAYLAQVERTELTAEDLKVVRGVLSAAAEDNLDLPQVRERAQALLSSKASRRAVERALARGEGFSLAAELGLPWQEPLLAALERDFAGNYGQLHLLLTPEQASWVDRTLAICERNLPHALATGPRDLSFPPPEEPRYHWLLYTVQFLKPFPGRGLPLVLTALESPVVNNRNMALNVLDSWREAGWTPSREVLRALDQLKASEVNEKIRERLNKDRS